MRGLLVLVVAALIAVCWAITDQDDEDYDHSSGQLLENVDSLLKNKKFMDAQIDCVKGRRKCDRVGMRIRGIVRELQNKHKCVSCNEEEREQIVKVINYVKVHYTEFWLDLKISDAVVQNLH